MAFRVTVLAFDVYMASNYKRKYIYYIDSSCDRELWIAKSIGVYEYIARLHGR